MGCESSVPVLEVHLSPLAQPVAAINQRTCAREFLDLRVETRFMQSGVFYQEALTQRDRFVAKGKFLSSRMTLLDTSTNAPIANYKAKTFSSKPILYVRAGSETEGPELFQIYARYYTGMKSEVRVEFRDVVSGLPCRVGFEGNWRRREGYFWLDRGLDGIREAVARVHCPDGGSYWKHHIVVTPNMDAALIVMICDILWAAQRQQESSDSTDHSTAQSAAYATAHSIAHSTVVHVSS